MLQGKPLASRATWFMRRVGYVLALVIALIVLLEVANGVWLATGLTVFAFAAGMLPELFIDFRYDHYRKEWELANRGEGDSDREDA